MYRRCGTFVLMHMHAYIHSESSNLHGTILVIYYVSIVLWGCILGLASSCLRMLSFLCLRNPTVGSGHSRKWGNISIHPSIHPSICLYFGGVQVIVWMRVDDDFDSFLSVVARFFEVKSCFRRYFSNCSDIWLCLNAGDQGTHSNPLVNHHTQISRIGWFDL